ncbi:uncharacterized protein SPAPADRAFT_133450 [Spathaspora passalidarum NRRL Y-27907]|uniref:Uncharacterized protein n=1 Tax=Spathaspora passalidarum (strain NRRL Y-27907 / 11-Y1) TaxID=619300 RepID=G3AIV5_SPAPN|nr:uncharacterized protein SPAPADRAFT_133450 [Spathaspora passalidarum NRRL Y-27907]EGW33766.1 hypothetical protein SPAPADRAFT_133450 [Spathaspora passalidarum NRRL Y-27907]
MGTFSYNVNSIEGDVYIQRLSTYIRKNEEALANGLLCFSKNRNTGLKVQPLRLSFTMHHLYYLNERIDSSPLDVDVGPLNVKLDNPNQEPTFISFLANNARTSKHFDSDTRSITSMNSVKSIVSNASVYWRSFAFSKDPKVINKDIKYLYSSFTKVPCLILSPKTHINSISSYEEYPCDTSVPVKMFKNLQVLEINDYEPNEIFGWHILSEQLRILIIRKSKVSNIGEVLFNLVIDDESGRTSFNSYRQNGRRLTEVGNNSHFSSADDSFSEIAEYPQFQNNAFRYSKPEIANGGSHWAGAGSLPKDLEFHDNYTGNKDYEILPDSKWACLKQLTISETSISRVPAYTLKPFSNLVKLNLSNNLLEDLPEGLDQLVSIKYLNFADNYITSLKKLPKNLSQLLTLNMNNNKLTDLTGLENLLSLEKIDLRRNKLSEIKQLKPVVSLFMKHPDKFNSVYLSQNKLPKNYRGELFNLFNGIKYKNSMKIDDSRPGYFESALLLDTDAAIKNLEKFLHETSNRRRSVLTVSVDLDAEFNNSGNKTGEEEEEEEEQGTPNTTVVLKHKGEKLSPKKDTLLDSFSTLKIVKEVDEPPPVPSKQFELSHAALSNLLHSTPTSPLQGNHNISNQYRSSSQYATKSSKPEVNSIPRQPSNLPPTMKRSNTLPQLDRESSNIAPNIVTQIQVTAHMTS